MPPILFVFTKTLKHTNEELSEDLDTSDYIEALEADWLAFWANRGEDIVHCFWSHKYSEYLLKDEVEEIQEDVSLQDDSEPSELEAQVNGSSWQELWDVHHSEVYVKTYTRFETVHYQQYCFYRPSIEIQDNFHLEPKEEVEYTDQSEHLKALGLPTSFGGANNKNQSSRFENSSPSSGSPTDTEEAAMPPSQPLTKPKKKKKNRTLAHIPELILQDKSLRTYWQKRFSLFSRFDEGIKLDRESWFSVTPEKVAIHMAERLRCDTIIDAFCGSGGNSIQFAFTCSKVIAIDIDEQKIKNAQHNANIYGVAHKIDFIIGDYLQLCDSLKGDVVFLSPPWGGPKYSSQKEYNIEESLAPLGATALVETSRQISENIAIFLPRNSNPQHIMKIAGVGNRVEIEHNYLDTRLVGLTAIYGDWLIERKNLSD